MIRNFWVEGECSDRNSPIGFGPRGSDDSIAVRIYMTVDGIAKHIYTIRGLTVKGFPELTILSETQNGKVIDTVTASPEVKHGSR